MTRVFALRAAVSGALLSGLTACASSSQGPGPTAFAPPPPPSGYQTAAPAVPRAADPRAAVVGGIVFPADGTRGQVPQGSKLTVRVYDAAGGDVNRRVAEEKFDASRGLPVQYQVPVAAKALGGMRMPAVAARVTGPGGRVIYRNEVAVLLRKGEAQDDIPMIRQKPQSASALTAWE